MLDMRADLTKPPFRTLPTEGGKCPLCPAGFPFIPTIVPAPPATADHSSPLPGAWLGNPEICCRCCCTVTKAAIKTAFSPDCKTAKL